MAATNTCEFPNCNNSPELAEQEGKLFKLNRIPISRPLSDKWELVFKFRLDSRIGQHLLICNRHFDEQNRRLILPQPIKKTSNRKFDFVKQPSSATPQLTIREGAPARRKAAKASLEKLKQIAKGDDDIEPPSKIKKEFVSDDGDFDGENEDDEDFLPSENEEKQPTARKRTECSRKSNSTDWWTKDIKTQKKPVAEKPKEKRSWWGDDSDSDHFVAADDHGGFDDRSNSPDNSAHTTYVRPSVSYNTEDYEPITVKNESKLVEGMQDIKVKLNKVDAMYEKLYKRPIEEACQEVLVYEVEREKERKTFNQQYEDLHDKYRFYFNQLHRTKWRNEQLAREIKIKTNKIEFLKKTFGKGGTTSTGNDEDAKSWDEFEN